MMGAARFDEHANHDAEKPRQLRHDVIVACGFVFFVVRLTFAAHLRHARHTIQEREAPVGIRRRCRQVQRLVRLARQHR